MKPVLETKYQEDNKLDELIELAREDLIERFNINPDKYQEKE